MWFSSNLFSFSFLKMAIKDVNAMNKMPQTRNKPEKVKYVI